MCKKKLLKNDRKNAKYECTKNAIRKTIGMK